MRAVLAKLSHAWDAIVGSFKDFVQYTIQLIRQ